MKKRRGTPSYNRIVTSVFALVLCASAAKADSRNTNNPGFIGEANLVTANVVGSPLPAKTVTGKVVDDKGETLIGVTVTEQGTTKAVATDANGNYSISVEGDNSVLVFAYLGYETQTQTVGARSVVNVTLATRSSALEEVVVTALGIKREAKKLGYATTSVNVDEISQNRTTNVMSSLEGKVAGLNISPPAAGPGSSTRIRLRGQASFAGQGATNSPLIVINGLPMDQGEQSVGPNNTTDRGDALQQINQDDIESMVTLKGSTAAALYGSRAANGAIIITTKTGAKNSKFGVDFSSNYSIDDALDYNRYQMEYGYGQWDPSQMRGRKPANTAEAIANGGQTWGGKYDGSQVPFFDGSTGPYVGNPNRITEYYRMGSTWVNTIALSGGNASTSYRVSFSNQDANGISPVNNYHKKIANVGINSKLSEKLTFTFNLNYTNEVNNNPPNVGFQGQGAPNFLYRMSPTIPLRLFEEKVIDPTNGGERQTSNFATTLLNPYYSNPRQFNIRNADRFLSTSTLRYDFTKWLYLQGRVAFDFESAQNESNVPHGVGSVYLLNNNGSGPQYNGSYNISQSRQRNMNYDFLLGTGNQRFGDFSAELTLGGNIRDDRSSGVRNSGQNFVVKDLYSIENTFTRTANYDFSRLGVNSIYGVADFGYKNYLYLSITDRVDWFSVLTYIPSLAKVKKNAFNYPSVSASFVFSELLPNLSWLNYGKIRASWASTGSSGVIQPFQGPLTYTLNANPYTVGTIPYTLAAFGNNYPNPSVTPFGVTEKEIGLEVRTLGSRLNFDVTVYQKDTKDQILSVPLSNTTGFTSQPLNLGKLQNKGIELMVEGTPFKTENFTWTSSINSAYNESKVLQLGPGQTRQLVTDFNGSGNEFLGKLFYQTGMAMNQLVSRTYQRNAAGQVVLTSGGNLQGSTVDGSPIGAIREVNFGQADPKWTGGWNNNFRYKKLALLVHFDWKFGGKVFSSTALNGLRQGLTQASLVGREGGVRFDGVLPNGQPNTFSLAPQSFYTEYRNQQIADPFVYKSDFIKLRNITLSYDFSTLVKNAKFIKGLSASVFVRNVAIIKKWIPDVDPESMASTGDTRLGYEQSALPTTRTFGLNLNVKF